MLTALTVLTGCGQPDPLPQWEGELTPVAFEESLAATAAPSTPPPPPAETATAPDAAAFLPTQLVVDSIGVDATVIEVGVEDRVLGVPEDPAELGRWSDGARPDDGTGSVVLTGHVDYQGLPGALRPLDTLQPGDEAVLRGADGQEARYVAERVDIFQKAALPYEDIFVYDVPERLVLITCGGTFDRAAGHYDSNVVAYLRRI